MFFSLQAFRFSGFFRRINHGTGNAKCYYKPFAVFFGHCLRPGGVLVWGGMAGINQNRRGNGRASGRESGSGKTRSGGARRGKAEGGWRVAICIDSRDQMGRERMLGCYQYASERNWRLYLFRGDDESAVARIRSHELDGAIFYDRARAFQKAVKEMGVVCVETGTRNPELVDGMVFVDNEAVVRMAVGHLRAAGFERLAYCGRADNNPSSVRARHFLELTGRKGRVFMDRQWEGETDIHVMMDWLKSLPKPIGVLTHDDMMAERMLTACRWADIRIPDEVGVIGMGNDELVCEMSQPRLTSIALPIRETGRMAAEMLEGLLSGRLRGVARLPVAPIDVVIRASTDRMPPARPAVVRAVEFMRAERHRPLGIEQVAAAAGMSRRTLDRIFAADLGRTVHDYLVDLRMQDARQLLRQTSLRVTEVARRSGYRSLTPFKKMFTARTGMPPSAYRRHLSQSLASHHT